MNQGPQELEGPFYNTVGWEKDHNGVHPVEMLARIAKFENKPEAKFEPYRRNIKNRGSHDCRKVVVCHYDNFQVLGNGKLEKQAKLVSARNMICKIKTVNIGIVNETLAAGVTLDPTVNPNPHKKPLVRQFKSFTSGGTLGTFKSAGALGSFVPASSSTELSCSSSSLGAEIISPPVCSVNDTDSLEIKQYQAYIEGKLESPTEKLPPEPGDNDNNKTPTPAPKPKIVFKRSCESNEEAEAQSTLNDNNQSDKEPVVKKCKTDHGNKEGEIESEWDYSNYGYHNNQHNYQARGRGRGWNNRGFNRGGYGYNNRGGYNNGGYGYGGW